MYSEIVHYWLTKHNTVNIKSDVTFKGYIIQETYIDIYT